MVEKSPSVWSNSPDFTLGCVLPAWEASNLAVFIKLTSYILNNKLLQITKPRTYKLVLLLPGHSAIGSKWVFQIKCDNVGEITQYCACVVAQGYTQWPGIDFFETYAPVARIESICIILSIAASLNWEIHLIDINSAFLNNDLPEGENIYLKQPPGHVIKGKENYVWFLIWVLYSLKQAGHLWYEKLKNILIKMEFKVSHLDHVYLFIIKTPKSHSFPHMLMISVMTLLIWYWYIPLIFTFLSLSLCHGYTTTWHPQAFVITCT